MQLNRLTIGALTADLTNAGRVREELHARGAGAGAGRPSLVVVPRSERVYVLAFDIGVDYVIAARVGLGGAILDRRELYRPRGDYALDDVAAHLGRFTGEMLSRAAPDAVCVGIGAAIAGVVRDADGLVRFAPTSAGSTPRSARPWPPWWPNTASTPRSRSATTRTWARSPSTCAAPPPGPPTRST